RGGGGVGLEALADLIAVHVGQLDVENDQVRSGGRLAQGVLAGRRLLDLIIRLAQDAADGVATGLRVVHHQYGWRITGHARLPVERPPRRPGPGPVANSPGRLPATRPPWRELPRPRAPAPGVPSPPTRARYG